MKKLIISGSLVVIVAVLAIGATMAFFNDTETSTGNVFTAGLIDLTVDSFGSTYNNGDILESQFSATDLTDEEFFSFEDGDLKPGDFGWRHLSIHAKDNPAYACLIIHNKKDDENTPIEPEIDAGDNLLDGIPNGELSKELELFVWEDLFPDGKFDPGTELTLISPDSFFDIDFVTYADSAGGASPLSGLGDIRDLSLFWCAGTLTVDGSGNATIAPGLPGSTLLCDGAGMGDIVQTDEFTADLSLYAEQVRNNPDFLCSGVIL